MSIATKELEARLSRVEKELAKLKASLARKRPKRWYREIVGDFADDKAHQEISKLGRLIRSGKLKG